MLISFSLSNFLSFNERQTFSMEAGKTRTHAERIFRGKCLRLTKCEALFGANASGKSNLKEAFQFVQDMVIDELPLGFSNKYFRQYPENKEKASTFTMNILLDSYRVEYSFDIILASGAIQQESLYKVNLSGKKKMVYYRDLITGCFETGDYFKSGSINATKLSMYGEDSISDTEALFLNSINHGKARMYKGNTELQILRDLYRWFRNQLTISSPNSILTGYPFFSDSNLEEITSLINALGTGIGDSKITEVPVEVIKSSVPEELFNKVVSDLEKGLAKVNDDTKRPSIMLRSYKEFYIFELDEEKKLRITTVEFSHENKDIFFGLKEESDGTARLLDLIEILLKVSDNRVFVIDEIDRCLHPALTTKVVEYFLKLASDRNTQLIITSHESRLLATEILRNDEICFVVKSKNGESIMNPLEEYQLRSDKKVYAALFDGTLENVIPAFDDRKIDQVLSTDRKQ